ncbi:MAG: hypothetical protein GY940_14380 [bacterium]|nr:hypothetical protein [bacterium]
MKKKNLSKKLFLNKSTISNLNPEDMYILRGGIETLGGPCGSTTCPDQTDLCGSAPDCNTEPGHTEEGGTCYEFCQ